MTPCIGRVLGRSHYRVPHRMMGRQLRRGRYRRWVYLPLSEAMDKAGLQEVENYVSLHQNTVEQFIDTRPIMDLFLAVKRHPGSLLANMWWEQEGLDLERMRVEDQEAEWEEGEEDTDRAAT